ncbi:YqiA/YcfP family alpha/beta fold hydrolase [Bordetella sp. N]|uniref:YqiA/YcfP family alpha/beta fold hydrolase n=1 Tax=Bordetella sp. N TaxID=1746199 RepID=UPI00070BA1D7|nr:YqiA/YcfP family alpha/beta fold hydrolase [Bordetella sp. N]ALM84980.1 esterase [Bordetella sp. N]
MILYLHGFRSSPSSFKARLMAQAMADRGLADDWRCPQLPASPRAAIELATALAQELLERGRAQAGSGKDFSPRNLTVIGSSLGGYYAGWLAEQLDCRAVLLNPAVHAPRDLATQVGAQTMYHSGEPFDFRPEYVAELAAIEVARPTQLDRYFLVAATGDEVLDWQEMRDFYAGSRQTIIPGSDHGIADFGKYLPEVLEFALGDRHS